MAIRRRANEALVVSAFILVVLNYSIFNDIDKDEDRFVDFSSNVSYNYVNPPPCRETVEEAIRLNELIANVWYKCKRVKRLPDESMGYHVCVDGAVGIQRVISGDRLVFVSLAGTGEDYRLEKTLLKIANHKHVAGYIVSSRPRLPIMLNEYASEILFTPLTDNELNPVNVFAADFASRLAVFARDKGDGKIDILKLGCIDCWKSDHLPLLLSELISSNALSLVRQLHLIVRIDKADPKLLYLWYKTIHRLFYTENGHFALYAAQQLGDCGRTILNCQYQLAFARIDTISAITNVLAPVAGMGIPDEEYNRLLWYLNQNASGARCSHGSLSLTLGETSEWPWVICDTFSKERLSETTPCLVYHFGIGNAMKIFDSNFHKQFPSYCKLNLFDPTLPHDEQFEADGVNLYSITLADESSGEKQPGFGNDEVWRLSSLSNILQQTNSGKAIISLLILDLYGGEWDIFEQLLSAATVSAFSQIVMRIRVWQGEENENYRQFYSWFHRLQNTGYRLFSSRQLVSSNGDNITHASCKPNLCFELGWTLS